MSIPGPAGFFLFLTNRLLAMALAAIAECGFVVVAGETLSIAAVVGNGNQPLFPGLK
jgi:hypothetical protein